MTTPRAWSFADGRVDLAPATATVGHPIDLPALPRPVRFDPARTALIVVDMQNDFCTTGGWLDSIGVDISPARAAIDPINRVASALRPLGVPIVWLNWGNRPDRANLPPNVLHVYDADGTGGGIGDRVLRSDAVLTAGSWGAAIVDELRVAPDDIHVAKFRMSGFWDTELDSILRMRRIETLLFAGVNADQCVLATLTDAACIGYDCVYLDGAAQTTSPSFCLDATVYNIRQCFGFTADADDLVRAITT